MKDFYAVLGVSRGASPKEVTAAYRKLAARYHPDRHQDNELQDLAEEKLTELNQAYDTLSDTARRAAYDAQRRGEVGSHFSASGGPRPGPPPLAPVPYARALILLAFVVGGFFIARFVHPRIGAVLGTILAAIWFGPRIYRLIKRL
ncbi:MAG: J domain-containing protein [Deltaproteobacteria bacterium]|nr:J domain-containing protein [Deltaproteobacteria bacterium]